MAMGRPTKYDPAFVDRVVPFLAQGYSVVALAGHLGVCYDTIQEWCKEYPDFSAAVQRGRAAAAVWWENVAKNNALTGEGNASTTIFGLKNRARQEWSDMKQVDHTSSDRSMSPASASDAALLEIATGGK